MATSGSRHAALIHVRFLCRTVDTRTTAIASSIEYRILEGGKRRERYARPEGLNYRRGHVTSFAWGENSWLAP